MISQYAAMQPTLVREPFHRPGRVYEEKIDGCSAATRLRRQGRGQRVRARGDEAVAQGQAEGLGGWHLVVERDDEKIRNLLLGLTSLLI